MNLQLKGNISQFTTTGKNLLKIFGETETINGITFTQNEDGSITVNGTATDTVNYISTQVLPVTPNKIYRVSGCPATGSNSTYRLIVRFRSDTTTNVTTISQYGTGEASDGRYSAQDTVHYILGEIQIFSGQTVNLTFYPQVEEIPTTSTLATNYEPYTGGIASPNPNYSQDIEVVTGENTITISNEDNTESQAFNIDLGNLELCKKEGYQDYIYKENNK